MAGDIAVTVDQKALDRAIKRIEQYADRPLHKRAQHAYLVGMRLMVRPIRNASPVGPTGNLRRSVAARANRLRAGEMAAATVGTRFRVAPHRHLVTEGTKAHSLEAKRPGKKAWSLMPDGNRIPNRYLRHPGSRANPFVNAVVQSMAPQVQSFINARVLDIGESFTATG